MEGGLYKNNEYLEYKNDIENRLDTQLLVNKLTSIIAAMYIAVGAAGLVIYDKNDYQFVPQGENILFSQRQTDRSAFEKVMEEYEEIKEQYNLVGDFGEQVIEMKKKKVELINDNKVD